MDGPSTPPKAKRRPCRQNRAAARKNSKFNQQKNSTRPTVSAQAKTKDFKRKPGEYPSHYVTSGVELIGLIFRRRGKFLAAGADCDRFIGIYDSAPAAMGAFRGAR